MAESYARRAMAAKTYEEALSIWQESIMDEALGCEDAFIQVCEIIRRRFQPSTRERPGFWYSHDLDEWLPIKPLTPPTEDKQDG